jgi:hypothetical protein
LPLSLLPSSLGVKPISLINNFGSLATGWRSVAISRSDLCAYVGLHRNGEHVTQITCPDCSLAQSVPQPDRLPRNFIEVRLKNFGTTPAYHPWFCGSVEPVPLGSSISRTQAESVFDECDKGTKIVMPTLWPSEERPYRFPWREREVNIIRQTRARQGDAFFVWRITYDDVFQFSHATYICYMYIWSGGIESIGGCGSPFTNDK